MTDLAASRAFYVDVLGLVVTAEDENAIYLRTLEEFIHHNLVLRAGTGAGGRGAGLPGAHARGRRPGRGLLPGPRDAAPSAAPDGFVDGIGDAVRVTDPLGFPYEFFYEVRARRAPGVALRAVHAGRAGAPRPLQPGHARRAGRGALSGGAGLPRDRGHPGRRGRDLRGVAAPQGDRARHRAHRRRRPAAAPHGLRHPRAAQHHRDLRQARRAAESRPDRTRPGSPRRLERLLPLPARSRRAPGRDLHAGLLHRRSRQPGRDLGRARQPAPRLVGQSGRAQLVHRGEPRCSTSTAPAAGRSSWTSRASSR